jgi:hypothetical protein
VSRVAAGGLRSLRRQAVGLHPPVLAGRPDNTGVLPHGRREMRVATPLFHRSGLRRVAPTTTPSADFCAAIRTPHDVLSPTGTRRRPPGVSPASFVAHPPDLQLWPLMDMDFATSCPLVRPALPRIRFLFVGSRLCYTLPSDGPSRDRPCVSLVLHLHQVAQGTFTPRTPAMPGTQGALFARRRRRASPLDSPSASERRGFHEERRRSLPNRARNDAPGELLTVNPMSLNYTKTH